MKVAVDRGLCMQNGECAFAAPNVYDASPDDSERAAVEDAAAACPMQAIGIE